MPIEARIQGAKLAWPASHRYLISFVFIYSLGKGTIYQLPNSSPNDHPARDRSTEVLSSSNFHALLKNLDVGEMVNIIL